MKRQVGETIYGQTARSLALRRAEQLQTDVFSPWDTLTVESPDGYGWAVFVVEAV